MPNKLAMDLDDPELVVVDMADDSRAVGGIEQIQLRR